MSPFFFLAAAGRCGSEFAAQSDRETVTVHAGEADRKERRRGSVGAGKVAQPRFVARFETEAAPAECRPDAQADIRAAYRAFGGVKFCPAVVVAELAADARAVPCPDGGNDRERARAADAAVDRQRDLEVHRARRETHVSAASAREEDPRPDVERDPAVQPDVVGDAGVVARAG